MRNRQSARFEEPGMITKHIRWHRLRIKDRMNQKKGMIRVNLYQSQKRKLPSYPVETAKIVPDWGIEEDAHGGKMAQTDQSSCTGED